VCLACPPR